MSDVLREAFRHNSWANHRLLEFCRGLSAEQLNASSPGAYGNVLSTLRHILGAEAMYRSMLSGSSPSWDWRQEEPPTLPQMEGWAADMTAFWEELVAGPIDAERMLGLELPNGRRLEGRAAVVLTQALHHGNVHREQVCTVLTTLGIEPPDLSGWHYGREAGAAGR